MIYNIEFDICALTLTGMMLVIFYYKKCVPNIQNKIFSVLLWVCFAAAGGSILRGMLEAYLRYFPKWLYEIIYYIDSLMLIMIPVLYTLYIFVMTQGQGSLKKEIQRIKFWMPCSIGILIILVNFLANHINGIRVFGQYDIIIGKALLEIVTIYYFIYAIILVKKRRNTVKVEECTVLYSFAIFSILAGMIQWYDADIQIVMFCVSIGLFLIFITIQNPREVMSDTGILNTIAMHATAAIYFEKKEEFTALVIRVNEYDYFRSIFGTVEMVQYLKKIAERLENYDLLEKDTYDIGNGCFVILCTTWEYKKDVAKQILKLFEEEVLGRKLKLRFTASICVIQCPKDIENENAMLEYIENFARYNGNQQAVWYAAESTLFHKDRVQEIEQAVERALGNGGFSVYYQPIFSAAGKRVHSAEALVRLYDEKLGNISPEEFIPISERNGSILRIGMFVFCSVCEFFATNRLQDKGIEFIEINLSVTQCMQKDLAEQFLSVLQKYDISTQYINLEITETIAAVSPEMLSKTMKTLSKEGIRFSLDDYGTGFSSLASLIEFPFSIAKIDKGMITKLYSEKTQIVMEHTIAMLKQLKLDIVVEGVETKEQVDMLTALGCDYLQGHYYAKPLSEEDFLSQL